MRRSLRKMLSPGKQEEPQGAVYQGVENDMDDSKDSLKVRRAMGKRDGSEAGRGRQCLTLHSCVRGFPARNPATGGRRALGTF